jgi:hypothetical protein
VSNRRWFVAGTALALIAAPSPAYAHVGHCTNGEAASTIGLSGLVAVVLFRPWRKVTSMSAKVTRLALPAVLALAVTVTGCGGTTPTPNAAAKITSPTRIQITQPTANQVTGPDITLVVGLTGGKVVQPSTGTLRPNEGHIHVSLDGQLVSMAYTTTQDLKGLTPGQHTILAEFVATNHQPFRNRPQAAVFFTVK